MKVLVNQQPKLSRVIGRMDTFVSSFPDDFGLPTERSPKSLRRSHWLGGMALGLVGVVAVATLSVPVFFPQYLPHLRTKQENPLPENGLLAQINRCRFDKKPCAQIDGLVAVKSMGQSSGPAIRNPVVTESDGKIFVVSNNLATEADNTSRFEAWLADEKLTLCRGNAEPIPRVVILGNNSSTSTYQDPNIGMFSENLDPFADVCQQWVSPNILPQALKLLDQAPQTSK